MFENAGEVGVVDQSHRKIRFEGDMLVVVVVVVVVAAAAAIVVVVVKEVERRHTGSALDPRMD